MPVGGLGRRDFLQGTAGLFGLSSASLHALEIQSLAFEYVGTLVSIDVYRKEGRQRKKVQSLSSQRPLSLTLDSSRRFLFAVNDVTTFQGLPTGSVESYNVDPANGHLSLICRIPLALSATTPRHLAISPDARHMVVPSYGGGLYNLLSIEGNGELSLVHVTKEIGCGLHRDTQSSSHLHSVVFHPAGEFVIGSDQGADRINIFRIEHGRMIRVGRLPVPPGSGPARLSIDPSGANLVVESEFSRNLTRYRFDCQTGTLTYEQDGARDFIG